MSKLNLRRILIIEYLLSNHSATVELFSRQLNCSERTIRYDIDIVDDWLKSNGFPHIIRKPNLGIFIIMDEPIKKQVKKQLTLLTMDEYEFNRDERSELLSLILLTTQKPIAIKKFEDLFSLSRGTLLKDIEEVENRLKKYSIVLKRKTGKGIWLKGIELNFRQALTKLNKEINTNLVQMLAKKYGEQHEKFPKLTFSTSALEMVNSLQIYKIQKIIEPLINLLDISLSDDGRIALYLHIGMVLKRTKHNKLIGADVNLDTIYQKKEFKVAEIITTQINNHFKTSLPKEETAYIALHILSNQRAPILPETNDGMFSDELLEYILQMTKEIEHILDLKFNKQTELVKGLLLHIGPAIYRAHYGIMIENSFVDEVKKEFGDIYQAVADAIVLIEQPYNITFPDEEIAYIAMHFGGKIPQQSIIEQQPTDILIICSSGIGTANLLKNRINSLFANVNVLQVLSYQKYMEKSKWDAELIISTIDVPSNNVPTLIVNPLLPKEDYDRLCVFLKPREKSHLTSQRIYEKIWPILQKHSTIHNSVELTEELMQQLEDLIDYRKNESDLIIEESLSEVIDKRLIQLDKKVSSWQEAIEVGTAPLEDLGVISRSYKDDIISIINKRGPYMAVAPGIMLAHGPAKKDGEVALSFTRLTPSVSFGHKTNDPISLLFVFVAPDSSEHVPMLQHLLESLINADNRNVLLQSKSRKDISQILSS